MPHPADFPDLPETPNDFQWGATVLQAHNIITTAYSRADTLLRQEEADPVRLRFNCDQIANRMVPILEALEPEVGDNIWVTECAESLGCMMVDLARAAAAADTVENAKITPVVPIHIEKTGRRGRPRKVLDPVWLEDAVSGHRKITLQILADALGIHRNTLRNYLKMYNVYNRYSDLSDHDLDILTRHFKQVKPKSGLRYLIGFLKTS
ncbi:hypothetical protein B0H11DRAFT_2262604 [Mycena galericulata]|nr:hypothetical protein B0H11DRAFT_2262604 [Mycena galericulata]